MALAEEMLAQGGAAMLAEQDRPGALGRLPVPLAAHARTAEPNRGRAASAAAPKWSRRSTAAPLRTRWRAAPPTCCSFRPRGPYGPSRATLANYTEHGRSWPRWDRPRRTPPRRPGWPPTSSHRKRRSVVRAHRDAFRFGSTHERRRTPRLGRTPAPVAHRARHARARARDARQPRRSRRAAVRRATGPTSCNRFRHAGRVAFCRSMRRCASAAPSMRPA